MVSILYTIKDVTTSQLERAVNPPGFGLLIGHGPF
jgi:hypothetical protein